MIPEILIGVVAFVAAGLTFLSGFGLGTILAPVFILFFPIDTAIALTGVVHLLNNVFKAGLIGKHAVWPVVLGFGGPALIGAWFGARTLGQLAEMPILLRHEWAGYSGEITLFKVIVAILLILFAIVEILPADRQPRFDRKALPWGGLLSGFFGGLSGHQGALRSAFLVRLGLTKEAFIASGILIALGIDIVRLAVYAGQGQFQVTEDATSALISGLVGAFAGAWLGRQLLRKLTLSRVQQIVAVGIFLMAILLGLGWL